MGPLSGERRELIKAELAKYTQYRGLSQLVADLLEDSQYWREAVKRAYPDTWSAHGETYPTCPFCGAEDAAPCTIVDDGKEHKADCPWVRSQE